MKKLLMMFCFFACTLTLLHAQGGGGQGGAQMAEAMKQRLKSEMKLTDVQVDSVMAIQTEFQAKGRQLRTDESLSDDQRKAKMEMNNAERKARWKNSLSDEQITKLEAMYDSMRKARPANPGNK